MSSVVLTNFYADMGGGEFALLQHARWLVEQGVTVHVLLFHDGPFVQRLRNVGCQVTVIAQRMNCGPRGQFWVRMRVVPKLVRLIRSVSPDYIMVYTLPELPFVAAAARRCGVPVVFRDQGAPRTGGAALDWREERLPQWIAERLAGAITTTSAEANSLINRGAPADKIKKVFYAVDACDGGDAQAARRKLEQEFDIPREARIAGIFGRLVQWKGQSVLLKAIAHCRSPHLYGLVVGGPQLNEAAGPAYEAALRQEAEELGIANRIRFTGFRNDTPELMAACDVVCHASNREPFGLVIVEAMMCGKPVIASDVSGPRESVAHGETGFLVPVGDFEVMSQYLNRLLTDDQLAETMGANGRRRALQLFEKRKNMKQLQAMTQRLIELSTADRPAQ